MYMQHYVCRCSNSPVFLWPCACVCMCKWRRPVSFGLVVSIIRSLSFTRLLLSVSLASLPSPSLIYSPFLFSISSLLPLSTSCTLPLSLWVMTFKSSFRSLHCDEWWENGPLLSVYSFFHPCPSVHILFTLFFSPAIHFYVVIHLNKDNPKLWSSDEIVIE